MASAEPSPTPNPDALKFTLDITLGSMINLGAGDEPDTPFARAVLGTPGVANLFGVNDFVTVTRQPGARLGPDHRRGSRRRSRAPLTVGVVVVGTIVAGDRIPRVGFPPGGDERPRAAREVSTS